MIISDIQKIGNVYDARTLLLIPKHNIIHPASEGDIKETFLKIICDLAPEYFDGSSCWGTHFTDAPRKMKIVRNYDSLNLFLSEDVTLFNKVPEITPHHFGEMFISSEMLSWDDLQSKEINPNYIKAILIDSSMVETREKRMEGSTLEGVTYASNGIHLCADGSFREIVGCNPFKAIATAILTGKNLYALIKDKEFLVNYYDLGNYFSLTLFNPTVKRVNSVAPEFGKLLKYIAENKKEIFLICTQIYNALHEAEEFDRVTNRFDEKKIPTEGLAELKEDTLKTRLVEIDKQVKTLPKFESGLLDYLV